MPEPIAADMTIEELAARTRLTTRNIRAYQTRNLIPPPVMKPGERVGYYTAEHVARLRLISRLQESGYSLAGIAHLLEAWQEGHSLEQVLGMEAMLEAGRYTAAKHVSQGEVERALPDSVDAATTIAQMRELGVLSRDGDGYRLLHSSLFELAVQGLAAGIPAAEQARQLDALKATLQRVAKGFAETFGEHVWGPYLAAGMPKDDLPRLQERSARLRTAAVEVVGPLMHEALDEEIDALAARLLPSPEEG